MNAPNWKDYLETEPLQTRAAHEAVPYFINCLRLLDRKERDYGPHAVARWGVVGQVMRLTEKTERLATLFQKGKRRKPVNESIRETLRDIANHAIIALMLDDGKWPLTDD